MSSVNLNALRRDLGTVEFNDVAHAVLPIKGHDEQTRLAMEASGQIDALELFAIAGRCAPTLSPAELMSLDVAQAGAIIAIARGHIAAVEALLPKASPAETAETSAPPSA